VSPPDDYFSISAKSMDISQNSEQINGPADQRDRIVAVPLTVGLSDHFF